MGKFNIVLSVFGGMIFAVLLLLSFAIPYIVLPVAAALGSLIVVSLYLLKEDQSLSHRTAVKKFYCPFRKMFVETRLRPSLFAYRTYDDVLKCSAFNGRVRCQKRCLNMQGIKSEPRPLAILH